MQKIKSLMTRQVSGTGGPPGYWGSRALHGRRLGPRRGGRGRCVQWCPGTLTGLRGAGTARSPPWAEGSRDVYQLSVRVHPAFFASLNQETEARIGASRWIVTDKPVCKLTRWSVQVSLSTYDFGALGQGTMT